MKSGNVSTPYSFEKINLNVSNMVRILLQGFTVYRIHACVCTTVTGSVVSVT